MPKTTWLRPDPAKEHYWGARRDRIDITRDEKGNWYEGGLRYDTFDMSRTPILVMRFIPVCPECNESCMIGFFNYEKDLEGNGGFAFRHSYHFWYEGQQMWGYPPPVRPSPKQPGVQEADLPQSVYQAEENKTYEEGRNAFERGVSKWSNPYDGRTTEGRSWARGWDSVPPKGNQ